MVWISKVRSLEEQGFFSSPLRPEKIYDPTRRKYMNFQFAGSTYVNHRYIYVYGNTPNRREDIFIKRV
jgi:hypothetical protein